MKEELRTYIAANMIHDPTYPLKDDEPMITGGLIDSFSLVELALFIEQTFGIHIDDSDLTAENMDTLDQVISTIQTKGS